MTKGILLLLYAIEVTKYYLAYDVFFSERVRRYWIPIAGGVGYWMVLLLAGSRDDTLMRIIMYVFSISALFLAQLEKGKSRISRIIILVFILNCLGEIFLILQSVIAMKSKLAIPENLRHLIANIVVLCSISIAVFIKSRLTEEQTDKLKKLAKKNMLTLVILMAMEMLLTIAGLNWAGTFVDNDRFQISVIILCGLSYIGVGMLAFFSIYLERTNKKIESLVENEMRLKDMQKRYYDTLLEREEDTRRYRHDMENHLICVDRLAQEGDIASLQRYVGQMRQQMEEIQRRRYVTGNDILDILTSHYIALLGEKVSVSVSGQVQTSIDEMKLCTIYANLLQNAVEELHRCEGLAFLEIRFQQGVEFSQILIRNSLSKRGEQKRDKVDSKNHGLGLYNVKRTVEAVGGSLELTKEEDFFQAVVTFKG